MQLFKRRSGPSELTAIALQRDGVCIARIGKVASPRPSITALDFRPWEDERNQAKTLTRVAADFGLKRSACTTVLAADEYKLLLTEAPDVKADELRAAVRWRIKDLIDFHINDATLDVFELPSASTAPGTARSMYAVVAQKQIIQKRIDLLETAGINLQIIDIPELAQRNLAALLPQDQDGVVMLSLQARNGLITVSKRGEIYLSRMIDIGVETLQQASNLSDYFDRIALEVQRSLDYFDSHFRQAPLTNLFVTPMPEGIPGLIEHLNANLSIKATALDLHELVDIKSSGDPMLQWRCFTAIGAALRQEAVTL